MGKRRRNAPNKPATTGLILNDKTYADYLDRFRRIVLSIFEWENLPDTMDSRWLEICLMMDGQAAMFYDDIIGFINTRATSAGSINYYGIPSRIHCYSYGNIDTTRRAYFGQDGKAKKKEQCILVMNNWERTPTLPMLELYAYRLTQAQRTADINIEAQRTPVLLLTDTDQLLTTKNAYRQFEDNEPVIVGDKNALNGSVIKALKTDAPFIADKIMAYKREIWNEFLTYMGLNNLSSEKKERMIVDESESNNEVVNMNLQAMLAPRQNAAKLFNQKFGLTGENEVQVKVRSDLKNYVKNFESSVLGDNAEMLIDKGVEENE